MSMSKTMKETRGWLGRTLKATAIVGGVTAAAAVGVEYGMSAAASCLTSDDAQTLQSQKVDQCTYGPVAWVIDFVSN